MTSKWVTCLLSAWLALVTLSSAQGILSPFISIEDNTTNTVIHFPSETGTVYRIMCRTNLTSGAWHAVQAGIIETNQMTVQCAPRYDENYYGISISPLREIPYDYYTWYRATANPDYAMRVRGYIKYYPNVLEVAIEMMDLSTGLWKAIIKSPTGGAANFVRYLRNVSPDGEVAVHGHDNNLAHPYAVYYLHIRKVANPNQKVIVTIPEALASVHFNEDKTITVNGLYTYDRAGNPQP